MNSDANAADAVSGVQTHAVVHGNALIISDPAARDQLIAGELATLGFTVINADSEPSGVDLLRNEVFSIVVITTTSGQRNWCRTVRRESPVKSTPVILVFSRGPQAFARVKARLVGSDAWLAWPVDDRSLRTLIIAQMWRTRHNGGTAGRRTVPEAGLLLEHLASPVVVIDAAGVLVSCNTAMERVAGRPSNTLIGLPWALLAGVEIADPSYELWLQGPFPKQLHTRWISGEDDRWVDWHSTGLFDRRGNLEFVVASGSDVTKLQRDAQRLVAGVERFRDFAETAADWFWETDDRLRLTYISEHHEEITGVDAADLMQWSLEQVINRYSAESVDELPRLLDDLSGHRPFNAFDYPWRRPDGETRVLRISAKPLFTSAGDFSGYRGVGLDITRSFQLTQKLEHQATHDSLTGLVNRREFEQRLTRVVESAHNQSTQHALFYLDLDKFKQINDGAGHVAGDELLRRLGSLFQRHIRSRDTLARLGGDEFAVMIEHSSLEAGLRVASALLSAVKNFRFEWQQSQHRIGVSVGLVMVTEATRNAAAAQQAADSACYAAKNLGGNRIYINHNGNIELDQLRKDQRWAMELKQALAEDRFQLDYQPIVPLNDGEGDYIEILLRMLDDAGKLVRPRVFWPVAERHNLVTRLDRWVLRATLNWLETHPAETQRLGLCFINLAPASIKDDEFLGYVIEMLGKTSVPANKICFEITEAAIAGGLSRAILFVKALKSYGCRFALDNFGHGQFSLATLKKLPVDFLKIDRMFVRHVDGDPINYTMVKSLHEISRVLGKTTIAEFVEDEPTLEKLREIGVNFAQGYHTGRPRALDSMPAFPHRSKLGV